MVYLTFFKTLYTCLLGNMQILQEERGIVQKDPIWMSISIRFHGFPGGNILVAGFPSFHVFLLCTAPTASHVPELPAELNS